MKNKKLPKDQVNLILDLYKTGLGIQAVADATGYSRGCVGKYVRLAKASRRTCSRLDGREAEIQKAAGSGLTRDQLAKKFGMTKSAFVKFCQSRGIKLPNGHLTQTAITRILDEDWMLLEELAKTHTAKQLADKWEVCLVTMRNWLKTRLVEFKREPTGRRASITKEQLEEAMANNRWRKNRAAVALDVGVTTIYRLCKQYCIKKPG